jgi:PST family polysaccharide transporter
MNDQRQQLKRDSARGVAWNVAQNLLARLLALIVVAILGRLIDKSAFGVIALGLVINSFAELVINQGFGEFITQSPDLTEEHLDTAFWLNALVGVVSTAVMALGATQVSSWFADDSIAPIVRWLSLSLVLRSIVVVPTGLLVRDLKFRSISLRGLVASAVSGVAAIVAALLGCGIWSLVIQTLVGDAVGALVLWRAVDWRPKFRWSRPCGKQLLSFGAPVFGAVLLAMVSRRLDTFIVGAALNMAMLGVYAMAQRTYQILLQVINKSMTEVAFSAFARLSATPDERRDAFYKVVELTAVICFPVYFGVAIVAAPLTTLLFGSSWTMSALPLAFFGILGAPFSLTLLHVAAIKASGRTRLLPVIQVVFLCIYAPCILLMVEHGPAAAAAANAIACYAIIPLEVALVAIALPMRVPDYLRSLLGPSLATGVMAAAAMAVMYATSAMAPVVQLVAAGAVGAIVYVVALRVLAHQAFRRCIQMFRTMLRPSRG